MSSPSSTTEGFSELPPPAKLGLGGAALAVIGGAGYLIRDNPKAAIILVVGLVLVVLLVIAFGKLAALKQKSKAKVFGKELPGVLRNVPQQVTSADSRAKLDDLRRKLEEGFTKLAATGKSPYVLPWYMIVGEPGSGKTKAIAAANIALPGFQDPLQGTGGTVNMNWWFTNSGIILDTAGRLMLPEVPASNNPEWDEFLRTLNTKRPDCPINGLILTIPADTLITDNEEKIYRKAGEIAMQFNKVQSTLGIRFPVFVLITKCDKILGFREFFECFSSPEEQAQLMGWSNPDKLDDPFRPELVEQHLEKVHEQLVRRRLRLIESPVNTEDASARRLDQIDALYELPDALLAIAPRLRRYLEPIFVAGPLSSRPLFLRGIYFTSSLQTGEALDKAISAIMGIDIVAAHGGPVVAEKPYFLRHVFQEKVFKEKGLVTRTSNVAQLKRRRKLTVIGAGFAAAFAIGGLMLLGNAQLKKRVADPKQFWKSIDSIQATGQPQPPAHSALSIVSDDGKYQGGNRPDKTSPTLVALHDQAINAGRIDVPPIFGFAQLGQSGIEPMRRDAYHALFQSTVIDPLVVAAQRKLTSEHEWSDGAIDALKQLLLIKAGTPLNSPAYSNGKSPVTALATYVFGKDPGYAKDRDVWENAFRWVYPSSAGGGDWPPHYYYLSDDKDPRAKALSDALGKAQDGYLAFLAAGESQDQATWAPYQTVADHLEKFDEDESNLLKIHGDLHGTLKDNDGAFQTWRENYSAIRNHTTEVTKALAAIKAQDNAEKWDGTGANPKLAEYFQSVLAQQGAHRQKACDDLIKEVLDLPAAQKIKLLQDFRTNLDRRRNDASSYANRDDNKKAIDQLKRLQDKLLAADKEGDHTRRFALDQQILDAIQDQAAPDAARETAPSNDYAGLKDALDGIEKAGGKSRKTINDLSIGFEPNTPEKHLSNATLAMLDLVSARQRYQVIEAVLANLPADANDWKVRLKEQARDNGAKTVRLRLAEQTDLPDLSYDPTQFRGAYEFWEKVIKGYCGLEEKPKYPETTPILNYDKLFHEYYEGRHKAWDGFRAAFRNYWSVDSNTSQDSGGEKSLLNRVKPREPSTWSNIRSEFGHLDVNRENESLMFLRDEQSNANQAISGLPALASGKPPKMLGFAGICVQNWVTLAKDDILDARATLLNTPIATFRTRYLLMSDSDPTLPEIYWQGAFKAALTCLADAYEKQAKSAAESIKALHRFPLADAGPELSLEDLKQLQAALIAIDLPSPAIGGVANQGDLIPDSDVNRAIERLKGSTVMGKDGKWTSRCKLLVDALVNNSLACQMTVPGVGVDSNEGRTILSRWQYLNIRLGADGHPLYSPYLKADSNDGKRTVQLPSIEKAIGQPLQFMGYEKAGDTDAQANTFPLASGNWPYLSLIRKGGNVREVRLTKANTYEITYFVDDKYKMVLSLEFSIPGGSDIKFPFIPMAP